MLEDIKIGTDSFRCLKETNFKDVYKLLTCIGQGGYGKVYKVEHKTFKYVRAMKSEWKFILFQLIFFIENIFLFLCQYRLSSVFLL